MKANDNFIIQTAYAFSGLSAVLVLIKLWQYDLMSWWFCLTPIFVWGAVMLFLFFCATVYIALLCVIKEQK
jgi:hypothetical protein